MVLLRMFTRTWITQNLGWDDATIFLAAVCFEHLRRLSEGLPRAT